MIKYYIQQQNNLMLLRKDILGDYTTSFHNLSKMTLSG